MPDYPLLPMPAAERGDPPKSFGFGAKYPELSRKRQEERLGPKFDRLSKILERDSDGMELRKDPSSIAPERAIVLEIAGSINDFYTLVRKMEGLDFLGDEEATFDPDEDFFEPDTRKGREGQQRMDRQVKGRLYIAMPDLRALNYLLSLWKMWQHGKKLPYGHGRWKDIFARLRDIRTWEPVDRIRDETIEFWREDMEDPDERWRIEVELWFHENEKRRDEAYHRVSEVVSEAGGDVLHHAVIKEIGYDAILIEIPFSEIARLVEREEISLVLCDDIMFLQSQSSVSVSKFTGEAETGSKIEDTQLSDQPPIAALLDGVPVQNHQLLAGRLDIDDPDGLEGMSESKKREHGTAMASLILHGDRNHDQPPLSRKLHVRPVLCAPQNSLNEEPRRDRLLIDVIHRAVKRIKEGDEGGLPTAPDVFLINLSLGDRRRPFAGWMSPWAKLLDYLAYKYRILFLVSAGNITLPLPIKGFPDSSSFENAKPKKRKKAVLLALSNNKADRTLLSPAEALNIITVGAGHDDAVTGHRGSSSVDPYEGSKRLPNVSSALGLGHRKVIKPDISLPGGREHVMVSNPSPLAVTPSGKYGLQAASPDSSDSIRLSKGTSAATALATRAGHRIFDSLMNKNGGSWHAGMNSQFYAVVVKALLVHRANWKKSADFLEKLYGPHGPGKHIERRDNIARLFGYGMPDIEQALSCASHRATLVGHGTIAAREANIHRIPLPPSLERVTEPRTITITVAWFSPINFRHQAYRQAKLEVRALTSLEIAAGVKRASGQPSDTSVLRGTVFHVRHEGHKAVPFVNNGTVLLHVFCRDRAGPLDQEIHYGIAVTIEAGESIPVYEGVRTRLDLRVRP